MSYKKLLVLTALQTTLLAGALAAPTKTLTQADLEKMVAQLDPAIPHSPKLLYPIKCIVANDDEANAGATRVKEGDGYRAVMLVNTGLLTAVNGDLRLVRACIAHELTHLSRNHVDGSRPTADDLNNVWTRQQEYEADKLGAVALVKSGYSKQDMVDLLLALEALRGRQGAWLRRLTGDHADPKTRAAMIADDPKAFQAQSLFDTGLAYEDARSHLYAKLLFEAAGETWPALKESYINAAKCALTFYYDALPLGVRGTWLRPDFGPLILDPQKSRATVVTAEDRERWASALAAANTAIVKNPGNDVAQEALALVQILEPDGKKDTIKKGADWFRTQMAKESDPVAKLRAANNVAVGLDRLGDAPGAYATMLGAQKGTTKFNATLGENLGRSTVKGQSKDDNKLAAAVMYTWLGETPAVNPHWGDVKKNFDGLVASAGLKAQDIPQKPIYLAKVVTLNTSGKSLGVLLPVGAFEGVLGKPEKRLVFNRDWPDFSETWWDGGNVRVWTELEGRVMRITSSQPGASLVLKTTDVSSTKTYTISVGMSSAELYGVLSEKAWTPRKLAQGGEVQEWSYNQALGIGVLVEGDKVKAITVAPLPPLPSK